MLSEKEAAANGYKTAITRKKLSAPMNWLYNNHKLLSGIIGQGGQSRDYNLLDYGCGKGSDAEYLSMDRYDPHFFPELVEGKLYDTITCTYVLNVVTEEQQYDILNRIKQLLKEDGTAYITVRRDLKTDKTITKRGTLQRMVRLDLPVVHETQGYCIYEVKK